ncbi:MAG: Gfo/Idh/MocA family oxidoreductase, partial [Verrucomicrobiia bacterium]
IVDVDAPAAESHLVQLLDSGIALRPEAHVPVGLKVIESGKHLFMEKPIGTDLSSATALLEKAAAVGLRVGCAPDTFLGAGHQTAREIVDNGRIGKVISATAVMQSSGPESWHPAPAFYYQHGGGPLLDMGPYYLTSLVSFLGPIRSVTARCAHGFSERVCGHESVRGQKVPVTVATHCCGVLEFVGGALATVIMSFDVAHHSMPQIELHGTDGSLSVPDPNHFGGEVRLAAWGTHSWIPCELNRPFQENTRILGLVDLLDGLERGRPSRCDGALAAHVLEAMLAFEKSERSGTRIELASRPDRPLALSQGEHFGSSPS